MTMKIYTKSGDAGETGLLFGGRVPKNDPRCVAYGEADFATSAMGLARALSQDVRVKEILLQVQREMFTLSGEKLWCMEPRLNGTTASTMPGSTNRRAGPRTIPPRCIPNAGCAIGGAPGGSRATWAYWNMVR